MNMFRKSIAVLMPFYSKITAAALIVVGFTTILFFTNASKNPRYTSDTVLGSSVAHAEVAVDSSGGSGGGSDSGSGCDSGGGSGCG